MQTGGRRGETMRHLIIAADVERVRDLRCIESPGYREERGEPVLIGSPPRRAVELDPIARRQNRRLLEQWVGRIGESLERLRDLGVAKRQWLAELDPRGGVVDPDHDEL